MAVKQRKTAFSVTTVVTMIAGLLVIVACLLPLYEQELERTRAMRVSIDLARHLAEADPTAAPADDPEAVRLLTQRLAVHDVPWAGKTDPEGLTRTAPLRDIAHQFNLDLEPTKLTPEFTADFLPCADEAAANPTVWNLYWFTRLATKYPAMFTPGAQARATLVSTALMLLPLLGLICLATPLLSRFETGSVFTPFYQAAGFAGLIAAIAVAFLILAPTDVAGSTAVGVPASTVAFGSLLLYLSIIALGAASIFGLAHRFWWMSLALYLAVLIGAVVLYFITGTGTAAAAPTAALAAGSGVGLRG